MFQYVLFVETYNYIWACTLIYVTNETGGLGEFVILYFFIAHYSM